MKIAFITDINDIIQRILIAILSWFTIPFIVNFLPQLSNYILILQFTAAIAGFFIPFIISPLLILIYILLESTLRFATNIGIYNFITFLSYLIFWIIINFYALIKYNNLRHIITTHSLLASQLGFSYLLYSGIGLKTDYKLGIFASLSFLPVFIVPYLPQIPPIQNIISTILIFLASYLFSLKEYYSLTGVIPIVISIYLLNQNFLFILPPLIVNVIPSLSEIFELISSRKRNIIEQRSYNERLISILLENTSILDKELSLLTNFSLKDYQNKLSELLKQNSISSKLEELKEIETKINMLKNEINDFVNKFLFNLNNEYKRTFNELQSLGFPSQFEPIQEDINIEDPSTFRILSNNMRIIKSAFVKTVNEIENFAKKLEELLGTEINKPSITKLPELGEYVNYLKQIFSKTEIESCMQKSEIVIQTLTKTVPAISKEIMSLLIEYNTEKVPVRRYEIAYEILGKVRRYAEEEIKNAIVDLEELIHNYKLESLQENLKILTPIISEGFKGSHCNVISNLITLIDVIDNTLEIRKDKESIVNVINTLKSLENYLDSHIKAGSCISVKELGISENYEWVVRDFLKSKGYQVTAVGEELCPSNSP